MKTEPDPVILELEPMNFEHQYNSDIENITDEMLEFLHTQDVPEEWLITIMQDLYLCNSDLEEN